MNKFQQSRQNCAVIRVGSEADLRVVGAFCLNTVGCKYEVFRRKDGIIEMVISEFGLVNKKTVVESFVELFKKQVETLRVVEDYHTAFEVLVEQVKVAYPEAKLDIPKRKITVHIKTTDMDGFPIGSFEHPMDDYGMSAVGVTPLEGDFNKGVDDGKE